ncbi:GntR family transcriptional regulator [Patulibacter minatonensis]|uniref:GntR family transcriptional regulator n=1 Tax=Patulibacter minatonensis TaxID=298163 RepID=UPI000687C58A|nr:GntR family transcriptional regulator [Patulibacter minatonensis]
MDDETPDHAGPRRSSGRGTGTSAPPHAERVYEALRDELLRGARPAGERLVEQRLAEQYETSRTPVREALRRLEGDGHLVRDPSGGLRPRVPDVRSMQELYDVRLALEDLVVRRATTAGDPAVLARLRGEWEALRDERTADPSVPPTSFVGADEAFHAGVAEAGGNRQAQRFLAEITARIHVLRVQGFTTEERVDTTIAEHLEILDAIDAGDPDVAAAFMRSHIQRYGRVVRQQVGEALARMFEAP